MSKIAPPIAKTDLADLLRRVEAAAGPDRELDEAIAFALCDEHEFVQLKGAPRGVGPTLYRFGSHAPHSALRVTASLDAALALVERVLPGAICGVDGIGPACLPEARVVPEHSGEEVLTQYEARGRTPALALLAALLRALIAQQEPQHA
jgi:hypothetical protein